MTINDEVRDMIPGKSCNMISTEKQKKYQHHNLEKLINMNILTVKTYYFLIKNK